MLQCNNPPLTGKTMSAWTGLAIAVGVSALICLALIIRAERIQCRRKLSSAGADGGGFATGDGGGYFWNWAGNHSAGDHAACSSGSDGWGGGDSGGGGDGDAGGG